MRSLAVVSLTLVLVAGCGTSSSPSADDDTDAVALRKQCTALREHVIDVRLQAGGAEGVDIAAHRRAFQQGLGDAYIDGCVKTLSRTQIDCALASTDAAKLTACIAPDPISHPATAQN